MGRMGRKVIEGRKGRVAGRVEPPRASYEGRQRIHHALTGMGKETVQGGVRRWKGEGSGRRREGRQEGSKARAAASDHTPA